MQVSLDYLGADMWRILALWPDQSTWREVGILERDGRKWVASVGTDKVVRPKKKKAITDFLRMYVVGSCSSLDVELCY